MQYPVFSVLRLIPANKVFIFCTSFRLNKPLVVYGLDASTIWDMRFEMAWPDELNGKWVDLIRAENNEPVMVFASEGVPIYEREPERQVKAVPL